MYQFHIFICENERPEGHPRGSCARKGSPDLTAVFKSELAKRNLKGTVRANKSGCLDFCEKGPVVVVYPEGIWYSPLSEEDVREIVASHIDQGVVVSRLLMK
ncbi:MAG: (2Fe-2S) ferredoxin domain-containing protein [Bacteroidetes bacterium]|nr:(2Fe-2S) ferredoxin domain-containing protein [Bacteroidota bacterium]